MHSLRCAVHCVAKVSSHLKELTKIFVEVIEHIIGADVSDQNNLCLKGDGFRFESGGGGDR